MRSVLGLYLVARLAPQWMMTKVQMLQTSRLVWWMVKSGPVFCTLARESKIHVVMLPVEGNKTNQIKLFQAEMQENSKLQVDVPRHRSVNFPKRTNSGA